MTDDPQPIFRCRCTLVAARTDDYYDRCPRRPSQEDGFCDWCRGRCQPRNSNANVPLDTPCWLAEVPF